MTFQSTTKQIVATLFGLGITAASSFFLWSVMQPTTPPSVPDRHLVYLFAGGIAFGMAFVLPSVFYDRAKRFLALLPQVKIGGNGTTP